MKASKLDNVVSDFSRFYILTILYEGPAHGYEIMTKFKERVGKKISPATGATTISPVVTIRLPDGSPWRYSPAIKSTKSSPVLPYADLS